MANYVLLLLSKGNLVLRKSGWLEGLCWLLSGCVVLCCGLGARVINELCVCVCAGQLQNKACVCVQEEGWL